MNTSCRLAATAERGWENGWERDDGGGTMKGEKKSWREGEGHFVSVCLLLIYSDVPRLSAF